MTKIDVLVADEVIGVEPRIDQQYCRCRRFAIEANITTNTDGEHLKPFDKRIKSSDPATLLRSELVHSLVV